MFFLHTGGRGFDLQPVQSLFIWIFSPFLLHLVISSGSAVLEPVDCHLSQFDPRVRQHSFVEIGLEITSTAILSLPLIQVRQLSVTGERLCTG